MSKFLDLPAELRHEILLQALPTTIHVDRSTGNPLIAISLVCRRINDDLTAVAHSYEPTHVVSEPSNLFYIRQCSGFNTIKHIQIQVFSTLTLSRLLKRTTASAYYPDEINTLIREWKVETARFKQYAPRNGVLSVALDITPVPGYLRDRDEVFIARLVNSTAVATRLWNVFESELGDIFSSLATWLQITQLNQQHVLKLTGTVAERARGRMPALLQSYEEVLGRGVRAALDVKYVNDSQVLKWDQVLHIVEVMFPPTADPAVNDLRKNVKRQLRDAFQNDLKFRSLFTKNALEQAAWTCETVLAIVNFAGEAKEMFINSRCWSHGDGIAGGDLNPLQRAFVHQLAIKLDLWSESRFASIGYGLELKLVTVRKPNQSLEWCKKSNTWDEESLRMKAVVEMEDSGES